MNSRLIDELGRIVLPVEYRRELGINNKDVIEVYLKDGGIFLKKSIESCILCSSFENLIECDGKIICNKCLEKFNDKNNLQN